MRDLGVSRIITGVRPGDRDAVRKALEELGNEVIAKP